MTLHELALYVCLRVRGVRMVRFLMYTSDELYLWPEENVFLTDTHSMLRVRQESDVLRPFSYSGFEKARSEYGFFNAFNSIYLDFVFSDQKGLSISRIRPAMANHKFYEAVKYERLLTKYFFIFIICPVSILVNILYILTLK